ncbi:hypothetical protein JCM14202_1719 [Agrilactobacillus composti DSM 18527 = JCM 14202]|nr:hypothetical protein JCM14202_1719 [Agrilactobacillus composti DSM 18527 = JCM 14202]
MLLLPPLLTKYMIQYVLPTKNFSSLVALSAGLVGIPVLTCGLIILDLVLSSFVIKNGKQLRIAYFKRVLALETDQHFSIKDIVHRLLGQ